MLGHKNLWMITICIVHNSGHIKVFAVKKSSRHIEQISGLNEILPRVPSNYNKEAKYPMLSADAAATKH